MIDTSPGNKNFYSSSIKKLISREELKDVALKDPFHYLTADLTAKRISDLGVDFRDPLGKKKFETAEQYSKGCILISVRVNEIPDGGLIPYVSAAISAFIVPVSHYLSEIKKIPIFKKHENLGEERTVFYHFLSSDLKDERMVGACFEEIYKIRNEGQHLLIFDNTGPIDVKEKKKENVLKRDMIKLFRGGINPLLRLYQMEKQISE